MIFPFMDFVDRSVAAICILFFCLFFTIISVHHQFELQFRFIFCSWAIFFVIRFQGQSELNDCKPCDFQMAIEEAFLAEQGYTEKLIADINMAAGNPAYDESILRGVQEATGSNQDPDCHFLNQVRFLVVSHLLFLSDSYNVRLNEN